MRKKFIFGLLLMLLFSPFVINASTIKDDVTKYNGENFVQYNSLIATSDGGYIVAGAAADNRIEPMYGNADPADPIVRYSTVVKYNKDNQVEWTKLFDVDELGNIIDIAETSDGYVLIGIEYRYEGIDPEGLEYGSNSFSTRKNLIVKIDKKGDVLWKKEYIPTEDESGEYGSISSGSIYVMFTDVEVNKDTYVIIGMKNGMPLVLKYDKNGTLVYDKSYNGEVDFNNLTITEDGGYVVAGYAYDNLSYVFANEVDPGYGSNVSYSSPFIIKFDKNDKIEWFQKLTNGINAPEYKKSNDSYGIMSGNFVNGISEIIQTSDGEYVIVGSFFEDRIPMTESMNLDDNYGDMVSTRKAFVAKYKTDGTMRWIKFYKDLERSSFYDVAESGDGSLWVGGSDSDNLGKMLMVNYSSDGEELSKKEITTKNPEDEYVYDEYGFRNVEVLNNNKVVSLGFSNVSTDFNTSEDGDVTIDGVEQPSFIYTLSEEYELEVSEDLSEKVDVTNDGNIYSIKVTPDKGKRVQKIIVKDKDGKVLNVEVTKGDDETYSFKLYEDVDVEVIFEEDIDNPKTGDNILLSFITLFISICGFVVFFIFTKRRKVEL